MDDVVQEDARRIRPGNRKDFGVAAALLAASLADDPSTLWLHPKGIHPQNPARPLVSILAR
ncbi:hypothetical protein ACWFPY_25880 [Nocardia fluminea]